MTQTEEPRRGTLLAGKYELQSILGRGGMGIVYRGRHLATERPIAVKVLRRELMSDSTLARRFVREAKAAAALQHPNVVDVLDYGVDPDGTAYQVLELLEGESLREHLDRKVSIAPEVALSLLLPVMHALELTHARGVIHRDLKPDNVFLSRNAHGRIVPKVLDFGIAKLMPKDGGASSTLATRAGSAIGTPAYMSPEQARGNGEVGPTTDVWAVGVMLFECVAGRTPFEAETGSILMARIIMEKAPSLASVAPSVPAPLAAAIDRALLSEQGERWPTMAAFEDALREACSEAGLVVPSLGSSDAAPMSLPPPRAELEPSAFRDRVSTGDDDEPLTMPREVLGEEPRARTALTQPEGPGRAPTPTRTSTQLGEGVASTSVEPASVGASARARSNVVPIVAISITVAALVFLGFWMRGGLWMREPDIAPARVTAPGPSEAPRSEPAAVEPAPVAPLEAASPDLPPVEPAPVPTVTEEVAVERPAAILERRALPSGSRTAGAATPRGGPAEPGATLPELTEW